MPLVGKEFQIYGALIYWEIDILTQTLPIKNYSLGSYHHPPGRGKLMIPPRQRSLKNLVPQQKGGRRKLCITCRFTKHVPNISKTTALKTS